MIKMVTLATLVAATMLAPAIAADAPAGPPGVKRVELHRWDVPGSAYAGISTAVEIEPNAGLPMHTHPGVEMAYVTGGAVTLAIQGQPEKVYKVGETFKIEANVPHSAKNAGTVPYKAVSTYIVEKDKPLVSPAK